MANTTQKRRFPITAARRVVQIAALVVFCLPLLVAGWSLFGGSEYASLAEPTPAEGIFFGSLSSSSIFGITILDPLAAAEVVAASKMFSVTVLLGIVPVLVVYGLIRGRAFCGWVCPVNLLMEGVDWLCQKLHIKRVERAIPRRTKIGVAAGVIVLSALIGIPVFQTLSPISAINKGILFGSVSGVVTLGAIVVLEVFWARRIWCRSLCPLGCVYQALGRVGQINVALSHSQCIHCGKCEDVCLADPEILQDALAGNANKVLAGDCLVCGACVDTCPTQALTFTLGRASSPAPAEALEPELVES